MAFPSGWPLCVYGLANRIRLRIRSCRKVLELFRYRNSHKRCETERTIRCLIGGDDGLVRWNQTEKGPGPSHLAPYGTPVAVIAWLANFAGITRKNLPDGVTA